MATRINNKYNYLILVRHGQSIYNLENKFTGWKNVSLTQKGIDEAGNAAKLLKNLPIDIAFTSNLKRAQNTLQIIIEKLNLTIDIKINKSLNERDYGDLVGQNKAEAAKEFGSEQVQIWRRSYNVSPPGGESLEMTYSRCIPYFKEYIFSKINRNNIIVSAHGNSIRAIVKYLLHLSEDQILKTEIGWCEPWIFKFSNEKLVDLEILYKDETNSFLPVNINELL